MSLSVPATRFVVALGAVERLVAVDEASASLPGLAGLRTVDLPAAQAMEPDLILVPDLETAVLDPAHRSVSDLARIVEFAPHDLEDVGALSRGLGRQIAGARAATQFERQFSRPVALVAGRSDSLERPRVVAVVALDPLTVAGGHSFETDLIEAGGGSSVTHGGDDTSIVIDPDRWRELAPDLVIFIEHDAQSPLLRQHARRVIPERYPVAFFRFDRDTFWLDSPEQDAERMRQIISSTKSVRGPDQTGTR